MLTKIGSVYFDFYEDCFVLLDIISDSTLFPHYVSLFKVIVKV